MFTPVNDAARSTTSKSAWLRVSLSGLLSLATACGTADSDSGGLNVSTPITNKASAASKKNGSTSAASSSGNAGAAGPTASRASASASKPTGTAASSGGAGGHRASSAAAGSGASSKGSDDQGSQEQSQPDASAGDEGAAADGGTQHSAGAGGSGASDDEPKAAGAGGHAAGGGQAGSKAPSGPRDSTRTYLSDTDRSSDVSVSPDGLSAEWLGLGNVGVRSTRSVRAHEGVFYFEVYANLDLFEVGVATAKAPLDSGAGSTSEGFGIDVGGVIESPQGDGQSFQRSENGQYGFVVDYREDHPSVYLIAGTADMPQLVASRTLTGIGDPLFIHLSGLRRTQGYQATINPGNDTVNQPFVFDARSLLQAQNHADVASALVLGWGATHSGTLNQPPTLSLNGTPPSTIDVGQSLQLTASASDAEDGASSAKIEWDVLSAGVGRIHGTGESFTFKPEVLGKHPIRIRVTDSGGKRAERTVTIEAHGELEQLSNVKLVAEDGLSGKGIQLSADGLSAHWTVDEKLGVRANQGLYGDFWYVEGHRLVLEDNQAIGLVIGGVSLNPYPFDTTPPSCSINTTGPSVFHDLMYAQSEAPKNVEYYGLAVDYRGDYPIAHIIIGGQLATSLHLKDVTVPIYPMLYGNVNAQGAPFDMAINFGSAPFHEDPVAVLNAASVNTSGLKLCWGNANSACRSR